MSEHQFVRDLVRQVPDLEPAYEAHLIANDELLPHVFMGDVTRFVLRLQGDTGLADSNSPAERSLRQILDALEAGMASGDDETQELIAVSFLENLDRTDPGFGRLRNRMGRGLLAELRRQDSGGLG